MTSGYTAVAYLNDKGGRIYWGITNEGIVSGVSLDAPQRDQLRQAITNKLNTTQPAIAPTMYEVTLHPIYLTSEGDDPLPDCFAGRSRYTRFGDRGSVPDRCRRGTRQDRQREDEVEPCPTQGRN